MLLIVKKIHSITFHILTSQRPNQKGSSLSSETVAMATPSPSTKMQTGHAHSMLMKLVAESDSKSVAFTEEVGFDIVTNKT